MSKIKHFQRIIAILFFMIAYSNYILAQNSCSSAVSISVPDTLGVTYSSSSNEFWLTFTPSNSCLYLDLIFTDDFFQIQSLSVYSGSVSNLTLISTSTVSNITVSNLQVNNQYFVKIIGNNVNESFKVSTKAACAHLRIKRLSNYVLVGMNDHKACENEMFEAYCYFSGSNNLPTHYLFTFTNGVLPPIIKPAQNGTQFSEIIQFQIPNNWGNNLFSILVVVSFDGGITWWDPDCTWWTHDGFPPNFRYFNVTAMPNITFTPTPNPACPFESVNHNVQVVPPYFGSWGDGSGFSSGGAGGLGFHQYQQTGSYTISATSQNMCGVATHDETVDIEITPDFEFTNQCVGNVVQFNDLTTCSNILGEWNWDFGDGMGVVYSTSSNPSHSYSNPGTYLVKLKVKTKYSQVEPNFQGYEEEFIVSKQITIYSKPEPASISGFNNNCDGLDDIQYMIDNFQSNNTYNWSITQGVGTFNNTSNTTATGQSNTIDWTSIPSLPAHAQIQILNTDNNGCQSVSTKNIFECCDLGDEDITLNNSTLSGSSLNYQGKKIMINGTLNIDADVIFEEDVNLNPTQIFMGPEAKIVVTSGHQIEFINSKIQSNCEYMWDGIYTSGASSIIGFENSELSEAINGVVAKNGSVVKLKNSDFINNYKSVQISDYVPNIANPLNYGGEIYGCNFYTTNVAANNGSWIIPANDADYFLHLEPLIGKQSYAAIMISNVGKISIGDASKAQNFFAKQQFGIFAETSEPYIKNNEFQYIKSKQANGNSTNFISKLPVSSAIYGIYYYNPNININKHIYIGDANLSAGSYSNTFDNCDIAIQTRNYSNKIFRNKFLNTTNTAMYLYDLASAGDIQYNYINNSATLNNARGILGTNTTQRKLSLNVANNLIYNMKWGISLTNCASFGNSLKVKVKNNQITLNPTNSTARYAIKVEACDRIEIQENNISRIGNSGSADVTKVVGISLRLTQSAKITDNYMYKMGSGIMTNGAMYNNQFFCNTMSMNYNGFYFGDNTGLTNFGWKNVSGQTDFNPHNKWVNNIGEKMFNYDINNQTPVNYYYYDQNWSGYSVNNDPEIGPSSSCYIKIDPLVSNSATFYCSNSNGPNLLINDDEITTSEERDQLLEEFLQGQEYEALQEQFRSYEIEYLYDVLDNDPSIMWLGGGEDEAYQEFYATVQNTVNAKFIDVDNYIAEGDFENAYTSNNAISPSNSFEANRQHANKVYLETYLKDAYMLAESTIDALTAIASQTPYAGGYGVYTARVMLDYDPDENGVSWRLEKPSKAEEQETQVRVFPNPAKEVLFVEVMSKMDSYKANMLVYNSMGQLVAEQLMTQKMEFINVSSFTTGVYFFTIRYENGHFEKGKFIIEQ